MNQERSSRESRRLAPLAAIGLFLIPLLYVLSVGPAAWLVWHDCIEAETVHWIYAPVFAVGQYSSAAKDCIGWYLDLFKPV